MSADAPATVSVLVPLPFDRAFDYIVPDGLSLSTGDVVEVPFNRMLLPGLVVGPGEGDVPLKRLKPVSRRFGVPPFSPAMRRFLDFTAGYNLMPRGAVLRLSLSSTSALEPPRETIAYIMAPTLPPALRLTDARRRVLAIASEPPPRVAADLAQEAGVGVGVVKALAEAGALRPVPLPAYRPPAEPDPAPNGPVLNPAQQSVATALETRVGAGYSATLLDGVTGSGKTEVYFAAIAAALRQGKQSLILLPEIALSVQWLERFARRFGVRPLQWHSDLTPAERRHAWRWISDGTAKVVVGARSALYLPYADLGLIVVDEEHDSSFKQSDGVIYHARDMAVARAHIQEIPVILASATPSLETVHNVETGRYGVRHLPERHAAVMPDVHLVNLVRDPPPRQRFLSPPLRKALAETLERGEQSLLFLNRRGYAPLTLCRHCGHRFQCPNCTAWLVEHRAFRQLQCHHCGHSVPRPDRCPECEEEGSLAACGPGIERIAEEVAELFPAARTAIMAGDQQGGARAVRALIEAIADHQYDIVIGTQIMAKGHNFPLLTLVGVVDADLGLEGGDPRAGERSFQLLSQVAGRAGRHERPGRVLIQTYRPQERLMKCLAAADREGFVAGELAERRRGELPPYGRLAALIVSGPQPEAVDAVADSLGRAAPRGGEFTVLGPAPAPLALLRGQHRRRLLVKAVRPGALQPMIRDWLERVKIPPSVRVAIDIDPQSFF